MHVSSLGCLRLYQLFIFIDIYISSIPMIQQQQQHLGDSRLWEKCARKLPLNSEPALHNLKSTLDTILLKCIDNPSELKYFSLKTTSKTFQSNILAYEGGLEFLIAAGFQPELQNGEKVLHLIDFTVEQLKISMNWLKETIGVCLEMKQSRNIAFDAPCAECQIQIRLPTSVVVSGGFMRTDLVLDVLSYARCYFQESW